MAHSILAAAYHVTSQGTTYRDLGYPYFEERDRKAVERRLTIRLERLGYKVILELAAA